MTEDKINILLVDDQPSRLLTYEAILATLGQNLVKAQSGTEALLRLMETEFAAILLDVSMPGMDGFETAAIIHQHPRFERTPIIFVTGVHVTDPDRLRGYQMGAVDYVYVPVIPEILRGKVQVLVQLYRQQHELKRLNTSLAVANEELAEAHQALKAENTRELYKLNSNLELANIELKAEIAERKRAQEALQAAAQRKDEFLAILAHELRNPLSAIHNGVQLMYVRPIDDPQLLWARDSLGHQVKHLKRLIDDLLDVSRLSSGRVKLQREDLDLALIVERAVEMSRPMIEARRHTLTINPSATPIYVNGDLVRLTQVLDNLISNAAKYTNEGGAITISVGVDTNAQAMVSVRDTGQGIPPAMLERVFELFTQATASLDRSQGGLGIGLALARGLVNSHGGTVRAVSEGSGLGSEFIVCLPCVTPIVETPAEPESNGIAHTLEQMRVLIVDDNVDSAQGLGMWLETVGHKVRLAHTGDEGFKAALEFHPDAVLLDIGLPGLNGYELAKRLRKYPQLSDVPLIAVTGFSGEADRHQATAAGFDHYLVKPIDYDTLLRALAQPTATVAAGSY
ncbi:MAG: response regulator [Gammaproteobacteria bacterium]|nr:response regulator [Gammaproteobacteria bacterium]